MFAFHFAGIIESGKANPSYVSWMNVCAMCVREFVIVDRLFSTVWMNVEPLFSFNLLLFSEIHATHLQTYTFTHILSILCSVFSSMAYLSCQRIRKKCVCVHLYRLKYQDSKGSTPNDNPLFATPARFIPSLFTFFSFDSDKYRSKHLLLVYFSFCQNLLSFWESDGGVGGESRIRNFENIYSRAPRALTLTKTQWKSAQNVSILLWFFLSPQSSLFVHSMYDIVHSRRQP